MDKLVLLQLDHMVFICFSVIDVPDSQNLCLGGRGSVICVLILCHSLHVVQNTFKLGN